MEETAKTETKIDGNKARNAANGTAGASRGPVPPGREQREARGEREPRAPREKAPPSELDQELRALKLVGLLLAKLDPGVRVRVLRYFTEKYKP